MNQDGTDAFDSMKPEFKAALEAHPPEGSTDRVWGQVSQQVDALSGRPGESGASGGRPSDSKVVVVIAAAAALILLLGLGVTALVGTGGSQPDPGPVFVVNENLQRLASAETKLDEAGEAVGHGEFGTADELIDGYSADIEEVEAAAEGDEEVADALDNAMPRLEEKFKALEAKVPEAARNRGIARAREVHARNAARKAARAQAKQNKGGAKDDDDDGHGRPPGKGPDAARNKGKKGGGGAPGGASGSGESDDSGGSGGSGGSGDSGGSGGSGGSGSFDPAG